MKKINEVNISSTDSDSKSNDMCDKNIENLDIHTDIKNKLNYFIKIMTSSKLKIL